MRITNNMMIHSLMGNLNRNMRRLDQRQTQYYTGKMINRPSDDPMGLSKTLRLRTDMSLMHQHKKNAQDASSFMESTETAIRNMQEECMQRIRELTVQAASETLTQEETIKIQAEIAEINKQLVDLGNYTYSGKYVFSGKQTETPLLDENGFYQMDLVKYQDPRMQDDSWDYNVSAREQLQVNTMGFEVFEGEKHPVLRFSAPPVTGVDYDPDLYTIQGPETVQVSTVDQSVSPPVITITDEVRYTAVPKTGVITDDLNTRATWETNDIDKPDMSSNPPPYLTFNGVTVHLAAGDPTEPNGIVVPSPATDRNSITLTINGDPDAMTEAEYAAAYAQALNELSAMRGSEVEGFVFASDGAKLQAMAPPNSGNLHNRAHFGGTVPINTLKEDQRKVTGDSPKEYVKAGQQAGLFQTLDRLGKNMEEGNQEELSNMLGTLDDHINAMLTARAAVGAKASRVDLVVYRIEDDLLNYRELMSKIEDADMTEITLELMNEENAYQASLAVTARIIQPTLLDFLR